MRVSHLAIARDRYESNGFYIRADPVLPDDLIRRAVAGMDAVRAGVYDTGVPPQPSHWNPGDDPRKLCKIKLGSVPELP